MVRRKGADRRKMYGLKGPRMETLIKTVAKKMNQDSNKAARKYRANFSKIVGYVGKRRLKNDERIALARAMDAIGLDPKKPAEKSARAAIQRAGQEIAELLYETNYDPDGRRDPEKHVQLQEGLERMARMVLVTKGSEALNVFNEVYFDKMSSIQIAHEEAGRQVK